MSTVGRVRRRVIRSRRLEFAGVAMLFLAIGFLALAYIVVDAPVRSDDHPGGFTPALRDLVVGFCVLVAVAVVVFGVRALRVALIIDESRLVIRNQGQTTIVRWESKPRFEVRDWEEASTIASPGTMRPAHVTYRFRGIVCVANGKHVTIAATAKMTSRDRVEQLVDELREAAAAAQASPQMADGDH